MSEKGHSTLTAVRVVKQVGLLPEGGGVVQEEAEQLGTVTVRVGPHRVPGTDGQQSSTAPVSGSYRHRSRMMAMMQVS